MNMILKGNLRQGNEEGRKASSELGREEGRKGGREGGRHRRRKGKAIYKSLPHLFKLIYVKYRGLSPLKVVVVVVVVAVVVSHL